MIKKIKYFFLVITLQVFTGANLAQAELIPGEIQVIDLGTLPGGTSSTAADINEAGNIVGTSETTTGQLHAFYLSGGVMTDLVTLPGGEKSNASGINDFNQVVGTSEIDTGFNGDVRHGFIWQEGVLRDLGAFPPQDDFGSSSSASAINNNRLITGNVDLAGVVWNLVGVPNFPPFPPYARVTDPGPFRPARANDINNSDQVVGKSLSDARGFLSQAGVFELLLPLGDAEDEAFGINQAGIMVGESFLRPPFRQHAVVWSDIGTVQDIGTLGGENDSSVAYDINDQDVVVGSSETTTGDTQAFIWHSDFGMLPLGTLGGLFSSAHAINNQGQIVGVSETETGERHATLWTLTLFQSINIDINPFFKNEINPFYKDNVIPFPSHGWLPIALLSTDEFDASSMDISSITLGDKQGDDTGIGRKMYGKLKGTPFVKFRDIDHDGDKDLIAYFSMSQLKQNGDLTTKTSELYLQGNSKDLGPILGSGPVQFQRHFKLESQK